MEKSSFSLTDSPCVAVCSTLFDEVCRGCGRTAAEVSQWVFMTHIEKEKVWKRILEQGYPRKNGVKVHIKDHHNK